MLRTRCRGVRAPRTPPRSYLRLSSYGMCLFCQDHRRLNAITQRSVEPLPQVDQLVDDTRGARFLTKLDLAMACMQLRIREEDQHKRTFWVPCGQYELRVESAHSARTACRRC